METKNPLVSVITCTKNSEKYLQLCLDSVAGQTYKNIEHIFIDAFSTDKTLALIERYRKQNPHTKSSLHQYPPKGIANALNLGFKHSTGDIVHFLHSDDYYYQHDSVEKAVNYFIKNPTYDWLSGNIVFRINNKKVNIIPTTLLLDPKTIVKLVTFINILHHENTFVKRGFLEKFGPFEEENKIAVEYPVWLRALKEEPPLLVNESFAVFIVHGGSTSTGNLLNMSKTLLENAKSWGQAESVPFIGDIKTTSVYKKLDKIMAILEKIPEVND